MRRPLLRLLASLLILGVLGAAVLAYEVRHALSQPRLPEDPGFDVDVRVGTDRPGPTLELVVLGDSLVAGVGATSAARSLVGRIASRASEDLGQPVHAVGFGVSGAVTREVIDEQLEQVPDGVDAIVIEVGSNDVTHRTPSGAFRRDAERLLREATALAPVVVLGSAGELRSPLFQQPLRAIITRRATQLREIQREVAADVDVPFMNVVEEVSPAYNDARPRSSSSDRFHPSDLGYDIWARPLAERLVAAISDHRASADGQRHHA
ncbi:MAG: hydrolase family protein [Thermoleophilia bacterium]|nr:hydrolase family protein [Thermoleophilia bacterium]